MSALYNFRNRFRATGNLQGAWESGMQKRTPSRSFSVCMPGGGGGA